MKQEAESSEAETTYMDRAGGQGSNKIREGGAAGAPQGGGGQYSEEVFSLQCGSPPHG